MVDRFQNEFAGYLRGAGAEQFLLSLTAATSHGFDGIQPDVLAVSYRVWKRKIPEGY